VDQRLYFMDEVPKDLKDFGEEDLYNPEDMFGTLSAKYE